MPAEAFFDTNILVYAAVGSGRNAPKRKRVLELIESTDFGTSAQVLQEFYVTMVTKAAYWDAAILAAAEALGTDTVYSEDLSHGQSYGRVRVVNPF